MKKAVVCVKNYINKHANGTRGTNVLTLECGHTKYQNGSVKIPKYCICKECDEDNKSLHLTPSSSRPDQEPNGRK